ncbi:MAG: phosphate acyltransferase PlsX [Rhodobacterales bacterium]|nr:phosphate acyltransferase PlsX [Rhodobacterales bacterium]
MGGDLGPAAIIEGAARLSLEEHDIRVLLVGDVPVISECLAALRYNPARLSVVGAEGYVSMDEKPGAALKSKPNCSILTAARLVRDGEAHALVSAGHTGATVLAAATTFERLPGIRRAALASVYPTVQRHGPHRDPFGLILDVGATLGASAEDLVGFAVMGTAYSSVISEIERPRVALLSNGTEPNNGTAEIIAAYKRLSAGSINFCGNVAGLDLPRGTVDVIVCDGFLGNVVLQMLEGVSEVFADLTKEASSKRLQWKIGLTMLSGGLRRMKRMTDWKTYGGAPLLGMDQIVIKAHGRSEARAIRNALKVAAKAVRGDLIGRIRSGLEEQSMALPDASS